MKMLNVNADVFHEGDDRYVKVKVAFDDIVCQEINVRAVDMIMASTGVVESDCLRLPKVKETTIYFRYSGSHLDLVVEYLNGEQIVENSTATIKIETKEDSKTSLKMVKTNG